jgi:hypothetical protein
MCRQFFLDTSLAARTSHMVQICIISFEEKKKKDNNSVKILKPWNSYNPSLSYPLQKSHRLYKVRAWTHTMQSLHGKHYCGLYWARSSIGLLLALVGQKLKWAYTFPVGPRLKSRPLEIHFGPCAYKDGRETEPTTQSPPNWKAC